MTYEDQVNNKAKSLTGWGIQASGTARLGNFQLYGHAAMEATIAPVSNTVSTFFFIEISSLKIVSLYFL